MTNRFLPFVLAAGAGLAYGVLLLAFGFLSAGAGHGCYVPIAVFSAPTGFASLLLQNALAAFIGCPFLWAGFGVFAVAAGRRGRAVPWGRAALLIHYVCAAFLISPVPGTNFADWHYLPKVWPVAAIGALVYAFGQVVIWMLLPWLDARLAPSAPAAPAPASPALKRTALAFGVLAGVVFLVLLGPLPRKPAPAGIAAGSGGRTPAAGLPRPASGGTQEADAESPLEEDAQGPGRPVPGAPLPDAAATAEGLRSHLASLGLEPARDQDLLPILPQRFQGAGAQLQLDMNRDGRPDYVWLVSDATSRTRFELKLLLSREAGYSRHDLASAQWKGPKPGRSCLAAWKSTSDDSFMLNSVLGDACSPETTMEDLGTCVDEVRWSGAGVTGKTFCH